MSTLTNTARQVALHPATRTVVRCVVGCAVAAARAALAQDSTGHQRCPAGTR